MIRAATAALLIAARVAPAQVPSVRGYYLNVGLWSDSTELVSGGFDDIQRLRFMTAPALGPIELEVAYEHLFTYNQRSRDAVPGATLVGAAQGGGEWLDLAWTIEESAHVLWRQRFDRLNLSYAPHDLVELTIGRQTISWATSLLLTPADPFAPFDPSDPFREYRAGVDALRAQIYPGPLTEAEFVVRPSDTPVGETLTALARGRGLLLGWEVSGWAGVLHDAPALGLGGAGGVGSLAIRGELSLREEEDDAIVRGTVGVDTRVAVWGRDLYLVFEYQHDGFGAEDADQLRAVADSKALARGELQVLSRDVAAGQAAYQLHPLLAADLLTLWSLSDGSVFVAAGASYSLASEATARAGLFLGFGDDDFTPGALKLSEFGPVPALGYLSLTLFF